MNRRNFIKTIAAGGIVALSGCAGADILRGNWSDYEKEGSAMFDYSFNNCMKKVPENFEYVVKIPELEVHYSSPETIKHIGKYNPARFGFSWSNGTKNKVWAPVGIISNKIFPHRFVLGHEIYNITRFLDGDSKIFNIYNDPLEN